MSPYPPLPVFSPRPVGNPQFFFFFRAFSLRRRPFPPPPRSLQYPRKRDEPPPPQLFSVNPPNRTPPTKSPWAVRSEEEGLAPTPPAKPLSSNSVGIPKDHCRWIKTVLPPIFPPTARPGMVFPPSVRGFPPSFRYFFSFLGSRVDLSFSLPFPPGALSSPVSPPS